MQSLLSYNLKALTRKLACKGYFELLNTEGGQ